MKRQDEVVQVPVPASISGAGKTEAVGPTPEVPADATVVAETTPSDNLNEAVGEGAAAEGDMASGEPVAESVGAGTSVDATVGPEPGADTPVPPDSDRPNSRRLVTGEEILEAQEAQEAEASKPMDKDVVALMQNSEVQVVTPLAKAALARYDDNSVELSMLLARVEKAIDAKSFRLWSKQILEMDEKLAYNLRSIGVMFRPLVLQHLITIVYLASLGVSRLLTIVRFPEKTWRVDQKGHILVKDGETERHIADMTVDDLRKLLAAMKAAQAQGQASTLQMWLQTIEAKCKTGMLPEFEIEVAPIKDLLLPKVQEWTEELTQAITSNAAKQDALLGEYRKKIANLKTLKEALNAEKTKASWWLDLLEGRGNDLPPEFQQNTTRIVEDAADLERRKTAEVTASRTKNRR